MSSQPTKRKLGAEFLCRVRYRNNLPPLPFAPKLIATPPLTARFVKYESTSLIEKTPYALAVDQDLGMPIDVATVQYLERLELGGGQDDQAVQVIAPEDRELFVEPPEDPLHAGTGLKRSKAPRPIVTWLRRSEYISSEASKAAITKDQSVESRFGTSGRGVKATHYPTLSSQTAGIDRTFLQIATLTQDLSRIKHPKRPHLRAVSSHAIFPDLSTWSHIYTLGQFATDPAEDEHLRTDAPTRSEDEAYRYARCVLRPMTNPNNKRDSFLNLFVPDLESARRLKLRRIEQEEDEIEAGSSTGTDKPFWYNSVRDYTYDNVNLPDTKHPDLQTVVLMFRDEGLGEGEEVFYNQVKSKISAKKKRAVAKTGSRHHSSRDRDGEKRSSLTIQFRQRTEEEEEERRARMREVGVEE